LRTHFEGRDGRQLVTVLIEQEASPLEVETVQRVLDDSGMPAVVSASYGRHSLFHPDWIVLIEVPLGAFVTGLAAKAGAECWDALRAFVERLTRNAALSVTRRERFRSTKADAESSST